MADEDVFKGILIGAGIALGLLALKKYLDSLEEEYEEEEYYD